MYLLQEVILISQHSLWERIKSQQIFMGKPCCAIPVPVSGSQNGWNLDPPILLETAPWYHSDTVAPRVSVSQSCSQQFVYELLMWTVFFSSTILCEHLPISETKNCGWEGNFPKGPRLGSWVVTSKTKPTLLLVNHKTFPLDPWPF